MLSGKIRRPGAGSIKKWSLVGLSGVALIVILSMLAGILANSAAVNPAAPQASGEARSSLDSSKPGALPQATQAAGAQVNTNTGAAKNGAAAAAAPPFQSGQGSGGVASQPLPPVDRLIIRNATLALTSNDVEKTLLEVRAVAIEKNGVVFQSSASQRDGKTYGTLIIQVPSAAFDDTINSVRKLNGVKIESETTSSQDVTEEYVDLQAQLSNLKATETELVRLLAKATNVSEVLTVQRELNTVRGEIDRRQGRLNFLDKRTAMSSLTLNISPVLPANAKDTSKGWDAGQVLETAWAGSLRGLQGLFQVLITVGVWAIWLGPLAALAIWLMALAYRRLGRPLARRAPQADPPPPAPAV